VLEHLKPQPALIDQVHDRLVSAIVAGRLLPGQKLTQESVAEMLGVSRQPVSHALQILKRQGLLVESGKRSLAVAPMDGQLVRDLYQVREALDGLAASLAAGRVAKGAATKQERKAFETALANGENLEANADLGVCVEADVAFHSALYRLSGNAQISATVAEQWPHFMRCMSVVLTTSGELDQVWSEHAAIAEAVFSGKVEQAGQLARAHTSRAGAETAALLDERASVA
jgi:DNA-binding GntR family transcriptional regulator